MQSTTVHGNTIVIKRGRLLEETHVFETEAEAIGRAAIIVEGLSWVGTPFGDCADIKGPNGLVDCAMLLVRVFVDTGRLQPFDPRPYARQHMLHKSHELFKEWVVDNLGGKLVEKPKVGDLILWQFGRTFSHGAIIVNSEEVVHAYAHAGMCLTSNMNEDTLKYISVGNTNILRPAEYFDVWSK